VAIPNVHIVYLDTNVALRPFDDPPEDQNKLQDFNKYVKKSEQLINLIGQNSLKWSTSDYFIRQFHRWIFIPENHAAIKDNPVTRQLLKHILFLLKAAYRIKDNHQIKAEARELRDRSSGIERKKLEFEDSLHIIASFKAKVDRFLTYDYWTILRNHKDYVDNLGKQHNPDYSCENPVITGFPDS